MPLRLLLKHKQPFNSSREVTGALRARAYASALLLTVIAILGHLIAALALSDHPEMLPQGSLLMLFLPAIVWSTLRWGMGPGVLSLVLSALSVSSIWLPPTASLHMAELIDRARLLLFLSVGFVVVLLATSARRAHEQAHEAFQKAAAAEERLRSLITHSPSQIFIKDASGRYLLTNSAFNQLRGLIDEEAPIGKTDRELFGSEYAVSATQSDQKVLKTRQPAEFEESLPTADGSQSFGLTIKFPILSASGEVLGLGGITTDITRRKQHRDELERAIRTRDDVLAMVSHDLKNPLNGIKLHTSLLSRFAFVPENETKFRTGHDRILRAVEQMNRLIADILDVSKLEAGKMELELAGADVIELTQNAVADFEELARTKSIELCLDYEQGHCWTLLDPHRFNRVLSNIIGNAVKFTPSGGKITIGIETGADAITVGVSDTGPGIAPEHLSHIFDRYWQVKETANKGTGLGLPIAKGIIEAHGGRIWAESTPGKGAKFIFCLPIRRDLSRLPRLA